MINDVQKVYEYFLEVYQWDHETIAVLEALMHINWDEQGLLDFIDYYGFDIDELNNKLDDYCF